MPQLQPAPVANPTWMYILKYADLTFWVISPLSAASILFEDTARRSEITYFVSAKALRSLYLGLKRMARLGFKHEASIMHIGLMAGLFYLYNHQPTLLKFRSIFELIFGENN